MPERIRVSSQPSEFELTHAADLGFAITESSLPLGSQSTFSSTLSPSVLPDLRRFTDDPGQTDILAVVAACVRHARPLALHIQSGTSISVLSVFPREQLFQCFIDMYALSAREFATLRLLHVEPEYPLDSDSTRPESMLVGRLEPLGPFLWRLAMHGANCELLPEIGGRVRYRLALGFSLNGLPIDSNALPTLRHLRVRPVTLDELSSAAGADQAWTRRLLNALYLQSGLMITRSFPTPWFKTG